jgi:hypothetical protein
MAEAEATNHVAKGGMDFLTKKVGPMPLGVWLLAGLAIWYYISKKNAAASTGTSAVPTVTEAVDPNTGVPYSQEIGAYGQQVSDLQAQSTTAGSGSTTAGQFTDNNSWSVAAINFLVAQGVDPSQANQAITLYLSGQTLTTQQQADVNLAIQAIGAPPSPPGPSQTNPGQVVTPPGTTPPPPPPPTGGGTPVSVTQFPPPSGLKATTTSSQATISWNTVPAVVAGKNVYPPSYTVRVQQLNGVVASYTTVSTPDATGGVGTTTVNGLHTKWQYKVSVWPNTGQKAPQNATITITMK